MKKYQIIYADPPWRYDFCKDNADKIEKHYPTMSYDELTKLEIPSGKNSVLYLWATAPKLREALGVMKAWGFEYKTHMIWDKNWIGMGYWFRGQHELLLVGVKGKFSPPQQTLRKSSILKVGRGQHSRKPDHIRHWINNWYPDCSKIELFARKPKDFFNESYRGWDCIGNDISGKDIRQELEELISGQKT